MPMLKKVALYQQPYDSTLKALFEANTADMLSFILGGPVEQITELTGEVLKPPLRIDRTYKVWCNGKLRIAYIELETDGGNDMGARMLEYFGIVYRKYRVPIIAIVMYPFRTTVPEPPLCVCDDTGEILRFQYRVIKLWEKDARQFMEEWPASLYTLVPTMKGANYALLSQALDAMAALYVGQHRMLRTSLLWFDLFLSRTDTVSAEDRRRIMQKLDQFDSLLSQSRYVQKKMAEGAEKGKIEGKAEGKIEGKAEGKAEGKIEGRIEALQDLAIEFLDENFSALAQDARPRVKRTTNFDALNTLLKGLMRARDEQTVLMLLDRFTA